MELAMKSLANKSGQAGGIGITGGAMLVVVGAAMLFIGIFLNSEIKGAINRSGFSTAENTTFVGISGNVDTAFTLLGVGMIVAGAAIIISILRSGF